MKTPKGSKAGDWSKKKSSEFSVRDKMNTLNNRTDPAKKAGKGKKK